MSLARREGPPFRDPLGLCARLIANSPRWNPFILKRFIDRLKMQSLKTSFLKYKVRHAEGGQPLDLSTASYQPSVWQSHLLRMPQNLAYVATLKSRYLSKGPNVLACENELGILVCVRYPEGRPV